MKKVCLYGILSTMNIYDKLLFSKYLEEGEHLSSVVHKHWIDVLKPMFKISFFGVLPPVLLLAIMIGIDFQNPLFYLSAVWLILGLGSTLYTFLDWYYDAWLLTDQAVIDVEWQGLLKHLVSRIEYGSIEGISYELNGFWGIFFKYGNMKIIKTSADVVELPCATNPRKAETLILEHQEKFMSKKNTTDSEAIKTLLADVIKKHVEDKK